MVATYPTLAPASTGEGASSIGALMDSIERLGLRFDLIDDQVRLIGDRVFLSREHRDVLARRRTEVETLVRLACSPWRPGPAGPPEAGRSVFSEQAA